MKVFEAHKNCLPKDKLQKNVNFPVSPHFSQADCGIEITLLEISLCFFHQNLRIKEKKKGIQYGHEIIIFSYPKFLLNLWKTFGVYLSSSFSPWVYPDLWMPSLIVSHSTEPFCLLLLGFGCFACCK